MFQIALNLIMTILLVRCHSYIIFVGVSCWSAFHHCLITPCLFGTADKGGGALGQQPQEQQWTTHQHHQQLGGWICPLTRRPWGGLWEQFKKELARPRPMQTTATATLFQNPSGRWPPLQGGVRPFTATKAIVKKFQQARQGNVDKHDS